MIFHKVKNVTPLNDYIISVQFENGTSKKYDVKPLFSDYDMFDDLQEIPGLFDQVKADTGGYGIVWNDDIDISCNELWDNGYT